jgi:hypothetical protein
VSLMVNPVLPGWALAASAVTLSVVGLIIVVILFALLRTPPANPRFTDFSIDKTELARGDVLELKWQAEDVTGLRLLVDGTPVATLEPQLANYSLNTDSFSGPISLQLEAWNGDQRDTRSVQVLVYEPMHVERFDATPQEMVRYVVQGLNLVWDVPGATRTRVTGLEDFTSTVIAADGPSGNFPDIPGIPLEPLIITLMGEDNYGNVLEHSLTVNLVNPECSPSSGPVQLYVGPGVVYQVVGTIPADATVVVDARDTSGGWLRVTGLSGLGSAWASSVAFNCATNFNVNDLRIETNVPTPAPTPTATLTPLPTFTPTLTPTLLPLPTLTPSG